MLMLSCVRMVHLVSLDSRILTSYHVEISDRLRFEYLALWRRFPAGKVRCISPLPQLPPSTLPLLPYLSSSHYSLS